MKILSGIVLIVVFAFQCSAQETYKEKKIVESDDLYIGGKAYNVKKYTFESDAKKPKNVIFMIGDGMGIAHVYAGFSANGGHLFLENCPYTGFSTTFSASDYVTDSGAGGTALATGIKTYNGAIGVNTDTIPIKSILEDAEANGLATGLVATSALTHATPASFIAHQKSRGSYEAIAADYLKTDVDVIIGGGYKHFTEREDGQDLTLKLKGNGYQVLQNMEDVAKVKKGKLAGIVAYEHTKRVAERGDMLPVATKTAINILDNDEDGFFLMVEGSQIDWAGHQNSATYLVEEMLDFDVAIGNALKFAAKNGETLVVVTADHETGAFAVVGGDFKTGETKGAFASHTHSAVMVPVFAFGPGAENFTGIMDNTDINKKIKKLLLGK